RNLFRGRLDPRHRAPRLLRHPATAVGDLARGAGELIGLLGVLRILLHGRGDLLHRSRGLFQAGRLLLYTLRDVGSAVRNLGRSSADLAARSRDGLDRVLQPLDGGVEVVPDRLIGPAEAVTQTDSQITVGQFRQA